MEVSFATTFGLQILLVQNVTYICNVSKGRGGLGNVIVEHFKSKSWWVCSVDINPNDTADENVLVDPNLSWTEQEGFVCKSVAQHLQENKVEAIINMAGN